MKKLLISISLLSIFVSCVIAQKSITLEELRNMNKKKIIKEETKADIPKPEISKPITGIVENRKEAETLAEGSYSKMEKPFIFVARTKQDYENLKEMVEGFSSEKEIDFDKQAVIAAFAGMKTSGGYSVSIYEFQDRTNVIVKKPPMDAIVTTAITHPYKIAVVPVEEENSLGLYYSEEFQNNMTTYKVTSSEFEFVGGFVGMQTKFSAEGSVSVMKSDDYISFAFNLNGIEKESKRKLFEIASGKLDEKLATLTRLEAGNFINKPHPPFELYATFSENKLSIVFKPGKRNYVVNDGFVGRGSLMAIKQE